MADSIKQRMDALGLDWDKLQPAPSTPDIDFTDAVPVPQNVVKRYKTTRGLGKAVARETDYEGMVRTHPESKQIFVVTNPNAEADRLRAAQRKAEAARKRK